MQWPAGSKRWLSPPLGHPHFSALPATPLTSCLLLTNAAPDLTPGAGTHLQYQLRLASKFSVQLPSYTTYQYQVIYLQLSLCTQHSARSTVLLNKRRGGWSSQSKKRPNVAFVSGLLLS